MIKLENFSFRYNKDKVGLENITLSIEEGYNYAIIGPNGSGKTTLINCIYGLYEGEGSIKVGKYTDPNLFRRKISISDTLDGGGRNQNSFKGDKKIIYKYLSTHRMFSINYNKKYVFEKLKDNDVDIKKRISTLSKGNKLMLFILNTLAKDSNYYIFDEPFASLDVINRDKILSEMMSLDGENKSIICSSHDLETIQYSFDYYIFMDKGKIIDICKLEDINKEGLVKKYLELYGGELNDS